MGTIYKPPRGKKWVVDFVDGRGHRQRKAVSADRRIAERALRKFEAEADLERAGLRSTISNDADVHALYADFRAHLAANGRRAQTLRHYDVRIPPTLRHIQAEKVSDITLDRIDGFKADRTAQGRAPRTINAAIQALRTMLQWAVRHGRIAANPIEHVELVERRKVKEYRALEETEIGKLLEASPPWYARLWRAFLATGLRKNELVELKWGDIRLNGTQKVFRVAAESAKTNREDWLPISPDFEDALRAVMPKNPDPAAHVFLNQAGRPWRNNLWLRLRTCLRAAGVDTTGVNVHSLRRTFGTRLAAAGVDVKTVQTLMRHKTIAMTMQLYVKPRAFNLRGAVESVTLPKVEPTPAQVVSKSYSAPTVVDVAVG